LLGVYQVVGLSFPLPLTDERNQGCGDGSKDGLPGHETLLQLVVQSLAYWERSISYHVCLVKS